MNPQTNRENLIKKLEKLRALADKGIGGEKENAEALLSAMMKKYGITDADLEAEHTKTYWFRYKTEWERKLLHQLAYKHLGDGHSFGCVGTYTGRQRKQVGIECTAATYIEIEADYEFYRAAWEEDIAIFYSAFINKNKLFPPADLAREDTDEPDLERMGKVVRMMGGIDQKTRHKALSGKED